MNARLHAELSEQLAAKPAEHLAPRVIEFAMYAAIGTAAVIVLGVTVGDWLASTFATLSVQLTLH
jgi:hypothetical protein